MPFVVPLAVDTLNAPREEGAVRYSASLLGVVSPSFYNPLFAGLDYNRRVLGVDPFEQAGYVGVIAALLAALACWKIRAARKWLLLALLMWVFSLGPLLKVYDVPLAVRIDGYATHISLPWALLQNLPLISMARTPARFNFAVGFAVSVLVGYGAAVIFSSKQKVATLSGRELAVRWLFAAVVMVMIAFEYQWWWSLPTIPGVVPAPVAALAARDDIRAVFDIPWYHPLVNKDGMFLQTGHGQPMIMGQVARRSPVNPAKVSLLQGTLDPALLNAAGVDIVILHKEYDGSEDAVGTFTRARLGDPFYDDAQIAVFAVPPYSGDPPAFTTYAEANSLYFYSPTPGTATLTGRVTAESGAAVLFDGGTLVQWAVHDEQNLQVTVIFTAGYHSLSVSNDPVCPAADDPALRCPPLRVEALALAEYQPILGDVLGR